MKMHETFLIKKFSSDDSSLKRGTKKKFNMRESS